MRLELIDINCHRNTHLISVKTWGHVLTWYIYLTYQSKDI